MTFKTKILTCLVTDAKGATDIIDVHSLDEIPTRWINIRVIRTEVL